MMLISFLRRCLYAILILWIISMITFWLSRQVPGDEVMDYISVDERDYSSGSNPVLLREAYLRVATKRGLDLPTFYFSITPSFIPREVEHILPKDERENVFYWIRKTDSPEQAILLRNILLRGLIQHCQRNDALCQFYNRSLNHSDVNQIGEEAKIVRRSTGIESDSALQKENRLDSVIAMTSYFKDRNVAIGFSRFIPRVNWNGTSNQYHQWMTGLLSGRPLISTIDGRNAWAKVGEALKWTLLLNGFALLIAMICGVIIGVWSAKNEGSRIEKIVAWLLFALFALPSFWLGTLFIYFLASGEWLAIFPTGGLGSHLGSTNMGDRILTLMSHLFLPVMCLALGSLAYVSRQMKRSVLHEYGQPYVTSLRMHGISESTILRKHVVSNALFPVITIIGSAVPALLSGSLVIEVIFSIPGMGRLMYNSLMARDWPVAFPILMLGATITVIAYLLTDIAYRFFDPRIKLMQR